MNCSGEGIEFVLLAAAGAVISDRKAEQRDGDEQCPKLSPTHMKEEQPWVFSGALLKYI